MSIDSLPLRRSPWTIGSRAVIGAALYAVLGLFSLIIPGTQSIAIRPAFALVPLFGKRFGVVAGFSAGLAGNVVIDLIQGSGLLWWNWSVANGLVGAIAALIFAAIPQISSEALRHIVTAFGALAAAGLGLLFVFTDVWLQEGVDSGTALVNYLVVLLTDGIGIVVLVPALDVVWGLLFQQAGS